MSAMSEPRQPLTAEHDIELLRERLRPRDDHHTRCDSRRGLECDCYAMGDLAAHAALDRLALLARDNERLREQQKFDSEHAAILSAAVGRARLALGHGDRDHALRVLDEASVKSRDLLEAALAAAAPGEEAT